MRLQRYEIILNQQKIIIPACENTSGDKCHFKVYEDEVTCYLSL